MESCKGRCQLYLGQSLKNNRFFKLTPSLTLTPVLKDVFKKVLRSSLDNGWIDMLAVYLQGLWSLIGSLQRVFQLLCFSFHGKCGRTNTGRKQTVKCRPPSLPHKDCSLQQWIFVEILPRSAFSLNASLSHSKISKYFKLTNTKSFSSENHQNNVVCGG